jgi:hypothetical protein
VVLPPAPPLPGRGADGGVENLGQGPFGGPRVGLEAGDQVAEPHPVGPLRHLDDVAKSGGEVRAGVGADLGGEFALGVGEVVGLAGERADEGGGEPVRPLPGPVPARLQQVAGEVVVG